MELVTRLSWIALALIHATPAAVVFSPALVTKLYGVESTGDIGVLLTHRGGLFLAVVAASLIAAVHAPSRLAALVVTAISMGSFLFLYAQAGLPDGALRKIAVADAIGLLPLALVAWGVWTTR